MAAGIPENVRALVLSALSSVRQLDVLLVMRESGRAREWTVSELSQALRSADQAVEADLAGLLAASLVRIVDGPPPTRFAYEPDAQRAAADALAGCYRTHRSAIIALIISERSRSLDAFSDAFRIRRKDSPDG